MKAPDFHGLHRYATPLRPKSKGPQAILPHERIYRCECCNDTGIVQVWKLNKWAFPNDAPLSISSTPVFCSQFRTCGNMNMTVFAAERDQKDGDSRTETLNLFTTPKGDSTFIGARIGQGQLQSLNSTQSRYIHDKVLEYRQQLSEGPGKAWVDEIKKRLRHAVPAGNEEGLTKLCVAVDLPPEPDLGAPASPSVEVTSPKDLASVSIGCTPAEAENLPITLETNDFTCPF